MIYTYSANIIIYKLYSDLLCARNLIYIGWNCCDSVLQDLPRTNNSVEAWHRGFEALCTGPHENLWRTIRNFQRSQSKVQVSLEQYIAGQGPPRKKRKYQDLDARLKRKVLGFQDEVDKVQYLRGVAHNLAY